MTADYRITERNNETDELIRVIAMLGRATHAEAMAVESDSFATDGNHVRLERFLPDMLDNSRGGWEYL